MGGGVKRHIVFGYMSHTEHGLRAAPLGVLHAPEGKKEGRKEEILGARRGPLKRAEEQPSWRLEQIRRSYIVAMPQTDV